jgi:hypothetical protein
MLSREQSADEITWTQLVYMEPGEIETAFRIALPRPSAPTANQPNPYSVTLRSMARWIKIWVGCAVAIQLLTMLVDRNTPLPLGTYNFVHEAGAETQVFGPLSLRSGHSLNQLSAYADLRNSWVQLDCALVNDSTGEVFQFANEFEFYSGVDSDGAWSEGKRDGDTLLVQIPSGTYHLVVDGSGGSQGGQPLTEPVRLTLNHDVVPWRNFFLALLLMLSYPAYLFTRSMQFEQQRWSDESPSPLAQLAQRIKQVEIGGRK